MVEKLNEEVESKFYDKETLIAEVEKSEDKIIRISIGERRGTKYINIREFYESDGEYLPGKAGLNVNDEVIEDLVQGLQYVLEEVL